MTVFETINQKQLNESQFEPTKADRTKRGYFPLVILDSLPQRGRSEHMTNKYYFFLQETEENAERHFHRITVHSDYKVHFAASNLNLSKSLMT